MCGIAGSIQRREARELKAMLAIMASRGPDDEGLWSERSGDWVVALGHRRLAIIDVAGGTQPMSHRHSHIVHNGEIYNFPQLRSELTDRGHDFHSASDTEVILHLLGERGAGALDELNGMFALALWDSRERRLLLARDRFGIKPLYYTCLDDGSLLFASELHPLLTHPDVSRDICETGLSSYLFSGYIHPPHTLIRGIHQLPPACYLTWHNGELGGPTRYWSPPTDRDHRASPAQLWELLTKSVERHLVADVPVGVWLSGGLDSSSVARLAANEQPTDSFSIGFTDTSFDESHHAARVANHIGTSHHNQLLDETQLLDVIDKALSRLDQPLADPSYLPTYMLAQQTAQHVKVVLGGDGGDELLGGYPTYLAHRYGSAFGHLPQSLRNGVAHLIEQLPHSSSYLSLDFKLRRFVGRWDEDPLHRHLRWMANLDLDELRQICPELADPPTLQTALPACTDELGRIMLLDLTTYLPALLTKVDRAAMAHGLEVRTPLLDNELADFALRLPSDLSIRRGQTKNLLRRAALPHLPHSIVRRAKHGFAIPLARWLRGPLKPALEEMLADTQMPWQLISREQVRAWALAHIGGRADWSRPLWALVVLHYWLQK